jgi:hypothetical protein
MKRARTVESIAMLNLPKGSIKQTFGLNTQEIKAELRKEINLLELWIKTIEKGGWDTHLVEPMKERLAKLKILFWKRPRVLESIAMETLPKRGSFYTHKQDKDITAIANYYEKKVKTERMFVLNPQSGKANRVVKVTMLK